MAKIIKFDTEVRSGLKEDEKPQLPQGGFGM